MSQRARCKAILETDLTELQALRIALPAMEFTIGQHSAAHLPEAGVYSPEYVLSVHVRDKIEAMIKEREHEGE